MRNWMRWSELSGRNWCQWRKNSREPSCADTPIIRGTRRKEPPEYNSCGCARSSEKLELRSSTGRNQWRKVFCSKLCDCRCAATSVCQSFRRRQRMMSSLRSLMQRSERANSRACRPGFHWSAAGENALPPMAITL